MSPNTPPDLDIVGALSALVISLVSGFISIARRILAGHAAGLLWITSEFSTAILCGYLMYNGYPSISPSLPAWVTLPIAVAFSAHVGGRIFQELESELTLWYTRYLAKRAS
jgi:hypothetical protein